MNKLLSLCSLLLLGSSVFPAGSASADWLVSSSGTRIETRGAWKVEGGNVVFTLANGTLSSIRLSSIDLEASIRASRLPRHPTPSPTTSQTRPKPIMVLTNDDIPAAADLSNDESSGQVEEGPASGFVPADGAAESVESGLDVDQEPGPIEVISWFEEHGSEKEAFAIAGILRNHSSSIVTDVDLEVTLLDNNQGEVARSTAFLDSASLAARANTSFKAVFPGVEAHEVAPRFTIRSRELSFEKDDEASENSF